LFFIESAYGIALTRFEVARSLKGLHKAAFHLDISRNARNMGSEPRRSQRTDLKMFCFGSRKFINNLQKNFPDAIASGLFFIESAYG